MFYFLTLIAIVCFSHVQGLSYCGTNYADSKKCRTKCPSQTNRECSSSETCYANVECSSSASTGSNSNFVQSSSTSGITSFCGNSWSHAKNCKTPCPSNTNRECATGEICYANVDCPPRIVGATTFSSSSSSSSPSNSGNVGSTFCGRDYADSKNCRTPCPSKTDRECGSGQRCFASVECLSGSSSTTVSPPSSSGSGSGVTSFCGRNYADSKNCRTPCPSKTDRECAPGQRCFASVECLGGVSQNSFAVSPGLVSAVVGAAGNGGNPLDTVNDSLGKLLDIYKKVNEIVSIFGDEDTYNRKTDQYIFFEGNFCSEEKVGSFNPRAGKIDETLNVKKVSFFKNDEARSVAIKGPIGAGEVLRVCDNPDTCRDDDWTLIRLVRNIPEGFWYCVSTFERSYKDEAVEVQYFSDNGLDGKVSRVSNIR